MISTIRLFACLLAASTILVCCKKEEAPKESTSAATHLESVSPFLEARRLVLAVEKGDGPTTDVLVTKAIESDSYVRRWALWGIGERLGDSPQVAEAIREGLTSGDVDLIRQAAVSARLITVRDSVLIAPLRALLVSEDVQAVWNSEVALGDMGATEAIPGIAAHIGNDRIGVGAIRSLGKIGLAAYPQLLEAYSAQTEDGMKSEVLAAFLIHPSDDPGVRSLMEAQAANGKGTFGALGRLWLALVATPRENWDAVTREAIASSDSSVRVILIILSREYLTPAQHLSLLAHFLDDEDFRVRYAAALMAMDQGADAIPLIPQLLRIPESNRDNVDVWIKNLGKKTLPALRTAANDERSALPAAILLAQLGEEGDQTAGILVKAIREMDNARAAAAALASMDRIPRLAGEALRPIVVSDDTDLVLRSLCRTVLVRTGIDRDIQLQQLLDLLSSNAAQLGLEEDKALQFKLTILPYCLAQCGPEIINDLKPYMDTEGTRLFAILSVAQMLDKHPEAGTAMISAFLDKNALVRRGAIAHLTADFSEAELLSQYAREIAGDPVHETFLRRDALVILGILAAPEAPPNRGTEDLLNAVLKQADSPWVAAAAHYAMAANAIDTPAHLDALTKLADDAAAGRIDGRFFSDVLDPREFRSTIAGYLDRIGPEAADLASALAQKE